MSYDPLEIDRGHEKRSSAGSNIGKNQRTRKWTNNKGQCEHPDGCSNKAFRGKDSLGMDLCNKHYRSRDQEDAPRSADYKLGYAAGSKAGFDEGYEQAKKELGLIDPKDILDRARAEWNQDLRQSFYRLFRQMASGGWFVHKYIDKGDKFRQLFNSNFGTRIPKI